MSLLLMGVSVAGAPEGAVTSEVCPLDGTRVSRVISLVGQQREIGAKR